MLYGTHMQASRNIDMDIPTPNQKPSMCARFALAGRRTNRKRLIGSAGSHATLALNFALNLKSSFQLHVVKKGNNFDASSGVPSEQAKLQRLIGYC